MIFAFCKIFCSWTNFESSVPENVQPNQSYGTLNVAVLTRSFEGKLLKIFICHVQKTRVLDYNVATSHTSSIGTKFNQTTGNLFFGKSERFFHLNLIIWLTIQLDNNHFIWNFMFVGWNLFSRRWLLGIKVNYYQIAVAPNEKSRIAIYLRRTPSK